VRRREQLLRRRHAPGSPPRRGNVTATENDPLPADTAPVPWTTSPLQSIVARREIIAIEV
jgi:hypothetical protein